MNNAMEVLTAIGTNNKLSNGATLIAFSPVSANPDDAYLAYIIAERQNGEYVSWLYNAEFDSCNHGYYYSTYFEARKRHINRQFNA
jgi:hypothetical protein